MEIHELKQKKFELVKQQRRMLDQLEEEKRDFTAEEKRSYDKISLDLDQLEKDILSGETDLERRRKVAEREFALRTGVKLQDGVLDVDPSREFRNIAEYLHAIARMKADGIRDPRLDALYERREQTMGTGASGGFAVPDAFDSELRLVQSQQGIVRSRATVIPAGSPPDAKLSFPALDQTSDKNFYGGVTIVHTGEGVTMTETQLNLREVSLEPKEMSAYIVVTQKLLNNWEAAGRVITGTLSSAITGQEDYDFMRGNGVNKALGFINCAAAITYTRAGAGAVSFADCYNMLSKILMRGGSYIWLCSQTVIPSLAAMVDVGNHAVWLGGQGTSGAAQGPLPSTLMGFPLVFSDRLPALGTKGDFNLVNLSYYCIKDGSGPLAASSEYIYFLSNKVVFKVVWNVDGHPWLTEPLGLEGSTSNTVSPFVILN
jgi:HK97 family phage major capsid protein